MTPTPGISLVATYVDGSSERHLNLADQDGGRVTIYLDVPDHPDACAPRELARLLEACSHARAVVFDLSQPSRAVIEAVAALGVPGWTDVHDYDGSSEFHAPFLQAASYVFMNDDKLDNPQDFLRSCVDRGAKVAVCTLGADSAVAMDAEHTVFHIPAGPVVAVDDSNGAGDAFMAGFLAAHLDAAEVATSLAVGAEQAARALGTVHLSPLFEQPDEASSHRS